MVVYTAKPALKEIRSKKMTQDELASTIRTEMKRSYTRTAVNMVENRNRNVPLDLALAISRILGVDLDIIFEAKE